MRGGAGALGAWLEPFVGAVGRKTRGAWAPLSLRGLLGPGERESLQPMAAGPGLSGRGQPHQLVSGPARDDAPPRRVLAGEADRLVGGPDAALEGDDAAPPKKGARSAGGARQRCGARWACGQAHQPLEQERGLGHFEGRSWTDLQGTR